MSDAYSSLRLIRKSMPWSSEMPQEFTERTFREDTSSPNTLAKIKRLNGLKIMLQGQVHLKRMAFKTTGIVIIINPKFLYVQNY